MCQLWGHVHAAVEEGRHGALPLQRLRALPQDERHQPAPVQTPEEAGKSRAHSGARRGQRNLSQGCFNSICPAFKTSLVFSCLGRSKTLYCPVLQTLSQAVEGAVGHGVILGFVVSAKANLCFSITAGVFGGILATLSSSSTVSAHLLLSTWSLLGEPLPSW